MSEQTPKEENPGLDALYPSTPAVDLSTPATPGDATAHSGPESASRAAPAGASQAAPAQTSQAAPAQPPQAVPPPPPPAAYGYGHETSPPRRRSCLMTALIVIVVAGAVIIGVPLIIAYSSGELTTGDKIGVISITGMIRSDSVSSPLTGTASGATEWVSQLQQAERDTSVKVIMVRINSPGGSPAASQAVYKEIMRAKARKPVVVSMADVAASGGYYIASAADTIVAAPSTLTGSIGVIMMTLNYSGLMNKYGVQDQTLTTGPYKDTGSPQRPMRPDEKALMKAMLFDTYDQFVTDVAAGRKMDVARVKKLADGRVYTGRQAKQYGLVDELGDFYDASRIAQQKAKPPLTGEPQYKFYKRTSLLSQILESALHYEPRTSLMEQALRQQMDPCANLLVMPGYAQMQ